MMVHHLHVTMKFIRNDHARVRVFYHVIFSYSTVLRLILHRDGLRTGDSAPVKTLVILLEIIVIKHHSVCATATIPPCRLIYL